MCALCNKRPGCGRGPWRIGAAAWLCCMDGFVVIVGMQHGVAAGYGAGGCFLGAMVHLRRSKACPAKEEMAPHMHTADMPERIGGSLILRVIRRWLLSCFLIAVNMHAPVHSHSCFGRWHKVPGVSGCAPQSQRARVYRSQCGPAVPLHALLAASRATGHCGILLMGLTAGPRTLRGQETTDPQLSLLYSICLHNANTLNPMHNAALTAPLHTVHCVLYCLAYCTAYACLCLLFWLDRACMGTVIG